MAGKLAVMTLVAVALVTVAARGDGPTPERGWYAGIGDGGMRIGFEVDRDHRVGDVLGEYDAGSCEQRQLHVNGFDEPDSNGRFRVTGMGTDNVVKGRFLTPTTARGKVITQESEDCPAGEYRFGFFVRRFEAGSGGAPGINPRTGRYAGAGRGAYVWFDVSGAGGDAVDGQAAIARGPCAGFNLPADGPDDTSDHRFRLEKTSGVSTLVIKGRFVGDATVRGKVILDTTHPECAGLYEFDYEGRRFRDPG
jgi:hypothetical protein